MSALKALLLAGSLMMGFIFFAEGCVVEQPREGYWDREHHRWWHEHAWHDCGEQGARCNP